jgi:hypothetical protein
MRRKRTVIRHLQELLATVEGMQPLPNAGSPEAVAMHDAWMKQHRDLDDLLHTAEIYALCTVPADVEKMLGRVNAKVREMQGGSCIKRTGSGEPVN